MRAELGRLAGGRVTVAAADQDVSLLREALRPSNQASDLFAGLSALLGFLFAFNAMLLTVPERREAIADLRLDGTPRAAIVQMVLFEALCLGVAASLIGLLLGYALSTGVFHPSVGYLAQTFTLGTSTTVGALPIVLSLAGGLLATCLASLVLLGDLRRGRPVDAVFGEDDDPGGPPANIRRWLAMAAAGLAGARKRSIRLGSGHGAAVVCAARARDDARGAPRVRDRPARMRGDCGRQSEIHSPAAGADLAEKHDTALARSRRDGSGRAFWQHRARRRSRRSTARTA